MGRAGRGGGGFSGGRSGGFSGGGRSGGFSGGGRAGRSSRPGSYHSPGGMPFGGPRIRVGPVFYRGGGYYGGGHYGGGGSGIVTVVVVIFVILIMLMVSFSGLSGGGITKSTVEREKLTGVAIEETGYYEDHLGWIFQSRELESGMKEFYEKTGVHPYLYLTDTVLGNSYPSTDDLGDYAKQLYEEKFNDNGHFLLVFYERNGKYNCGYYVGASALSVMDDEALEILRDYLNRYYYTDTAKVSDEEMFSRTFSDTANRIMTVTRSYWPIFFAVVGVLVILWLLFHWWKKHKEQKNKEAEQTERILNTPLETFGDVAAEETAKKYQTKEEREE